MLPYEDYALNTLKEVGFRITRPRRVVIALLAKATQALSAYEIKQMLEDSGEAVDTVSVYRILECLEENHLIHRVQGGLKVRRCLLDEHPADDSEAEHPEEDYHSLLVCQRCDRVEEVHLPGSAAFIHSLEATAHFQIPGQSIELKGLCSSCS